MTADRPAYRRYVEHTAGCWAYAQGLWCHDCDAADFDADVEARERAAAPARRAAGGVLT